MSRVLVAWFDTVEEADQAAHELLQHGFTYDEVFRFTGKGGGDMLRDLGTMDVPEDHARTYAEFVNQGGSLVVVNGAQPRLAHADRILHGNRNPRTEELSVERIADDKEAPPMNEPTTGTPAAQTVELRSEKVVMNRHSIDRPVAAASPAFFKEETYEWIESAEIPVVTKQTRIVEEVVVGKGSQTRVETVSDTVRQTHVDVERLDAPDDHEPADRFGSELNLEDEWSVIEPQAREEWEREHPGTWDRFRETVRSSWERNRSSQAEMI